MNQEHLNIAIKAVQTHAAMHPRPSQVNQAQAAEMLNISRATVCRLVKHGTLKLNDCGMIPITEIDKALATS